MVFEAEQQYLKIKRARNKIAKFDLTVTSSS